MSDAAAIKATWSSYKHLPTRNCLQLVLEVPLEQQADVFRKLGYPTPGSETWVGVALLRSATDKPAASQGSPAERRRLRDMSHSQRAGIRCADVAFQRWMEFDNEADTAAQVRVMCGVKSRAELDTNDAAATIWLQLENAYMQASGHMAEMRS